MKMTNAETQAQREHCKKILKKYLKPGTKVYTSLTSVSKSGMTRGIDVLVPISTIQSVYNKKTGKTTRRRVPEILNLSWHVAQVLEYPMHSSGGVKVGGCGMDMGYHLIYNLSRTLFAKRTKTGKLKKDSYDCGYALNHSWI